MHRKLLALIVLVAAVTATVVAENQTHRDLDQRFRDFVAARYPGVRVDRSDVRGQPYLLSRVKHVIPTAYAYLDAEADGARRVLLVQNLDIRDGDAERVRALVTLPYPDTRSKPVLETTPDRAQAVLDGELVTYRARVVDGTLVVETEEHGADPRYAPAPVAVTALLGAAGDIASREAAAVEAPEPTRVVTVEDGVLVEFTQSAVPFGSEIRTDGVASPNGNDSTAAG